MNKHPFFPFGSFSTCDKARAAAKDMPFSVKVTGTRGNWSLIRVS